MGEQAFLVKFGQHAHILKLQEKGLLYMNNLPYFWKIEDEELRGDPFDSVHEVQRGHEGKISWSNGEKESTKITNWTIRIHPQESKKINIFCMYALRPFTGTFPVDEKNFRFGDYALVVTDPQQFIDRICLYLTDQNIKGNANLVKYVDDGYIGKVGPFKKLKRFAYQSEWRLVCYDGPERVRKISIGSIRDISSIIPSNEINEKITIKLPHG